MKEEEFRSRVIAQLVAQEAVLTALASRQADPAFRQEVMRAVQESARQFDGTTSMRVQSDARKILGVKD